MNLFGLPICKYSDAKLYGDLYSSVFWNVPNSDLFEIVVINEWIF